MVLTNETLGKSVWICVDVLAKRNLSSGTTMAVAFYFFVDDGVYKKPDFSPRNFKRIVWIDALVREFPYSLVPQGTRLFAIFTTYPNRMRWKYLHKSTHQTISRNRVCWAFRSRTVKADADSNANAHIRAMTIQAGNFPPSSTVQHSSALCHSTFNLAVPIALTLLMLFTTKNVTLPSVIISHDVVCITISLSFQWTIS